MTLRIAPRTSRPPAAFGPFRDEFVRASVLLISAACIGAVVAGIVAARLTPIGIPASGGRTPAAHVVPALTRVPSRVETNGAPLTVMVHAGTAREDPGYRATRYVVTAQLPGAAPIMLCDSPMETDCALPLSGSPQQRGIWVFTLVTTDNEGAVSEERARMRVT